MIPCCTFEIDSKVVAAVRNNQPNKIESLFNELNDRYELEQMLNECYPLFRDIRGQAQSVRVDKASLDAKSDGTGQFSLIYDAYYDYTCDDLSKRDEDLSLNVSFNINFNTKEISISGEDIPERESDEY